MPDTRSATDIASRAGTQFAVLRSLCYPDSSATSIDRSVDTFDQSTTTHARTDGRQLEKINSGFFQKADAETRFVTILHEVSHAGGGAGYGRGRSGHSPDFWEEFQTNFHTILDDAANRRVVESLFAGILDEWEWHRTKYRAIQCVSQVDRRSETVDERREKMANVLDYDGYDDFEDGDWGFHMYGRGDSIHPDETAVNIMSGTKRFADEFSDEELLDFVAEHDGAVPMPVVVVDADELREDGPQIVRSHEEWKVSNRIPVGGERASRKALAVQERLGHGYSGLSARMVARHDDKAPWAESSPVPVDDLPSIEEVEDEVRRRF